MDYSHKIIPPSYDVVFKAIFGREESKPLRKMHNSNFMSFSHDAP